MGNQNTQWFNNFTDNSLFLNKILPIPVTVYIFTKRDLVIAYRILKNYPSNNIPHNEKEIP